MAWRKWCRDILDQIRSDQIRSRRRNGMDRWMYRRMDGSLLYLLLITVLTVLYCCKTTIPLPGIYKLMNMNIIYEHWVRRRRGGGGEDGRNATQKQLQSQFILYIIDIIYCQCKSYVQNRQRERERFYCSCSIHSVVYVLLY